MHILISKSGDISLDFELSEATRERLAEKAFHYALGRAERSARAGEAVVSSTVSAADLPEVEDPEVEEEEPAPPANGHNSGEQVSGFAVPTVRGADLVRDADDVVPPGEEDPRLDDEPRGSGTPEDPVDAATVERREDAAPAAKGPAGVEAEPVEVKVEPEEAPPEKPPARRRSRAGGKSRSKKTAPPQRASDPDAAQRVPETRAEPEPEPSEEAAAEPEAEQSPEVADEFRGVVHRACEELSSEANMSKVLTYLTDAGIRDADRLAQACEALSDADVPAVGFVSSKMIKKAISMHLEELGA